VETYQYKIVSVLLLNEVSGSSVFMKETNAASNTAELDTRGQNQTWF
jgi:hypothetical protein